MGDSPFVVSCRANGKKTSRLGRAPFFSAALAASLDSTPAPALDVRSRRDGDRHRGVGVAESLLGIDLAVRTDAKTVQQVDSLAATLTSLIVGLVAWALVALLEKWTLKAVLEWRGGRGRRACGVACGAAVGSDDLHDQSRGEPWHGDRLPVQRPAAQGCTLLAV